MPKNQKEIQMLKITLLACVAVTLCGCMPPCGSTTLSPYFIKAEAAAVATYNAPAKPNVLEPLQSLEPVNAQDFVIRLSINEKQQSSAGSQSSLASLRFSLFKNAYACSPPDNSSGSSQRLYQLNITSNEDFNVMYPAGASLNSLFQIETLDFKDVYGMEIDDLFYYGDGEVIFFRYLDIRLTESPELGGLRDFIVEINDEKAVLLSGVNLNVK